MSHTPEIANIKREIDDRLSPDALDYWAGCGSEIINEIVIHAQRHGIDSAVSEIEALAVLPPYDASPPAIGVREDFKTGQYVGTINGKDVSPTSFDKERALEIARDATE